VQVLCVSDEGYMSNMAGAFVVCAIRRRYLWVSYIIYDYITVCGLDFIAFVKRLGPACLAGETRRSEWKSI
jgi:hypothetical protein